MNVVSAPPSEKQIDKLRAEHQAKAKLAAALGAVPKAFLGDPTFQELVSVQRDSPAPQTGCGLLAEVAPVLEVNSDPVSCSS